MHPVHLAEQSCETKDHRHAGKQFHPLSEPISTSHFEDKQGIWYLSQSLFNIQVAHVAVCYYLTPVTQCSCLSFCLTLHILPSVGFSNTPVCQYGSQQTFAPLAAVSRGGGHCLRARVAGAQRDEAASVWNQIQSWVMGKRRRGILDALAHRLMG